MTTTKSNRHGLTLQACVLSLELPEAAAGLLADFTEQYQPVGRLEHHMVEMLAMTEWNSIRAEGIRAGFFENAIGRHSAKINQEFSTAGELCRSAERFRHMIQEDDAFRLLIKYIAELRRSYTAKRKELEALQKMRAEPKKEKKPDEPKKPAQVVEIAPPIAPGTPRNALCPCGSGAKFKRCCGPKAPPVLGKAA